MSTRGATKRSAGPADGRTKSSPLHFEESGIGPPIVFVAGLGGHGRFWSRQMAYFSVAHRVITYDHPGCGRSSAMKANRSIESMSADLAVLMDQLAVEQAVVVGHSTGGAIAQVLASERPDLVSRVVFSSTWLSCDDYMRSLFRLRLDVLASMGPGAYAALGKILGYGPHRPTAEPRRVRSTSRESVPLQSVADINVVGPRIEALLAFEGAGYASRLRQPALILCARDDMITPAYHCAALQAAYPQAVSKRMEYGGHFCPQTRTATYNGAVRRFIQS